MPANGSTLVPWIVDVVGNDLNGGTSQTVLGSGTDGATNGTNNFASASASFTSAMIGHGIQWGANWRIVTAIVNGTNLTFSGAVIGNASGQTYTIGGPLRTLGSIASLSAGPLVAGDVIAVAPSALHYREAVTLNQGGAAVGGAITAITAAIPAVVSTTANHGLLVGQYVFITGVVGASEVNGVHKVTAKTNATYTLDNTVAPSAWVSGGVTEQLIAIVGDVDGLWSGKTGAVTVSAWVNGDFLTPSGTTPILVNAQSGWLFQNLNIMGGTTRTLDMHLAGSQFIAAIRCAISNTSNPADSTVIIQGTADTAMHLLFDRCLFLNTGGQHTMFVQAPTTATAADYDLDILIQNCIFVGNCISANHIFTNTTGGASHKPGGVRVRNGSLTNVASVIATDGNFSQVIPLQFWNSFAFGSPQNRLLSLGSDGNLVEDYNVLQANTLRAGGGTWNPGPASIQANGQCTEVDQTAFQGRATRPYLSPMENSPMLGAGNTEIAISGGAATITDDATVGTIAWSNPSNASYPDGTNATAVITLNADSHYLNCQGFGLAIPGNAVIDGIRVDIDRSASASNDLAFTGGASGVKLIKGGTISGGNHTDSQLLTSAAHYQVFGGPCDLWGLALTPADVNGATFGVALSLNAQTAATAQVDYVRMIVYYHLPTPFIDDALGRPRPAGAYRTLASGTATAGGNATLTDSGASWGVNQFFGCTAVIISGTGSGQRKFIKSNTKTVLTGYTNWATNPDNTSVYAIYSAGSAVADSGKCTSGQAGSLTDSNASWKSDQWDGYTLELTGGTGSGQKVPIRVNTGTVLSIGPNDNAGSQWVTNPDNTTTYAIYKGVGGGDAVQSAAGAYERHQTEVIEHTVVDVDPALRIDGPGDTELLIAVDAVATSPTIKYRSTASATPSVQVLANAECGVVASVVQTGTASQGAYTTLTVPSFTPTKAGVVRMRITSGATKPEASGYFDTASAG